MKFAVLGVAFVILAGTFFIMFTMYNYFYYNDTTGLLHILSDTLNDTMSPHYQNESWNTSVVLRDAFGIGSFIWLGIALVCFAVEAMKHPRMEE